MVDGTESGPASAIPHPAPVLISLLNNLKKYFIDILISLEIEMSNISVDSLLFKKESFHFQKNLEDILTWTVCPASSLRSEFCSGLKLFSTMIYINRIINLYFSQTNWSFFGFNFSILCSKQSFEKLFSINID